MAALTRYNALDCLVAVDNAFITQLAEDMVTGEKDEDYFETEVGAYGDVVKNENNNNLGKVTVRIQSTSPQRKYLTGLKNKKDPFPIWVTNKTLGERFGGTKANLISCPERSRGKTAGEMEFVFQVFDYTVEDT